jgi:hypothetical protein
VLPNLETGDTQDIKNTKIKNHSLLNKAAVLISLLIVLIFIIAPLILIVLSVLAHTYKL